MSDIDNLKKALSAGTLQGGQALQVEDMGVILKQVTFNANHLTPWPLMFEGMDRIHSTHPLFSSMAGTRKFAIFSDMMKALAEVRIIKEAHEMGGTIYVDARPWFDEKS